MQTEPTTFFQPATRPQDNETIRNTILDMCLALISGATKCRCVGIRVEEQGDFPLVRWQGFSEGFVKLEQSLLPKGAKGEWNAEDRLAHLECACGRVIRGERTWCKHLFSAEGSFWVNNLSDADAIPASVLPEMRGTCLREGFQSFALVPCRPDDKTLALLHVCDRRRRVLSKRLVERLEKTGQDFAKLVCQFRELRKAELQLRETGLKQLRLLVVDDEEEMAYLVARMLEAKGHRATTALSGSQAIDIMSAEKFDIVLTDFNMPVMSGLTLASEIKKRWQPYEPPVILMSGTSSREMAVSEKPSPAVAAFLSKPFSVENLMDAVRSVLN